MDIVQNGNLLLVFPGSGLNDVLEILLLMIVDLLLSDTDPSFLYFLLGWTTQFVEGVITI